jgi:membrane associated rhomboid family serine protease
MGIKKTNPFLIIYRWLHLLFNLLVQVLVGLPLEMVHGSMRIGAVYMAGVLAGEFLFYFYFFRLSRHRCLFFIERDRINGNLFIYLFIVFYFS